MGVACSKGLLIINWGGGLLPEPNKHHPSDCFPEYTGLLDRKVRHLHIHCVFFSGWYFYASLPSTFMPFDFCLLPALKAPGLDRPPVLRAGDLDRAAERLGDHGP